MLTVSDAPRSKKQPTLVYSFWLAPSIGCSLNIHIRIPDFTAMDYADCTVISTNILPFLCRSLQTDLLFLNEKKATSGRPVDFAKHKAKFFWKEVLKMSSVFPDGTEGSGPNCGQM